MKLQSIYFPSNVIHSSYYKAGLITAYFNCNILIINAFKIFIFLKSIFFAIRDIKYCHSVKSFISEVKDTYLWSISLYQVQYENAKSYYSIKRFNDKNYKSYKKLLSNSNC